jgi:hypothetical protein
VQRVRAGGLDRRRRPQELTALCWIGVRTFTRPIPEALDFVALGTLLVVLWIHWDNSRSLSRLHRRDDDDDRE